MNYAIERRATYLHAELRERESAAETRVFLQAVKSACLEHGCPKVLVNVRQSRAVFKAEDYGLGGGYAAALATPGCRIALVGDTSELQHAHEYLELVARQQRVNVRAFRDAGSAIAWLNSSDDVAGGPGSDAFQPAGPSKLA